MDNAVEVKDLTFGYDDKTLFEEVTFQVEKGDFAAIIGDNGVGKSTMIKLLLGFLRPDRGEIRILGEQVYGKRGFPGVGYVPQNSGAMASSFPATVEEIIRYSVIKDEGRKTRAQINEAVEKSLEEVGMKEYKKRLISELSGGQQQRVMLARVLVNKPSILILDEPTVGIDGESVLRLLNILHELNIKSGVTILMVTHDLPRIAAFVNRVLCISDNSLVEQAMPETTVIHAHSHKHGNRSGHIHCASCTHKGHKLHDSVNCDSCKHGHDH